METREAVQVHETCVVPYRISQFGLEFCLVTPSGENKWEFPKISVDDREPGELLHDAASRAGLEGPVAHEPLGEFVAHRGNETRSMIGYLMQVTSANPSWPLERTHKRLWCLAEECRVRIRRKPLRQFIDLALHAAAGKPSVPVNGHNGHNGNGNGHGRVNGNGHAAAKRA